MPQNIKQYKLLKLLTSSIIFFILVLSNSAFAGTGNIVVTIKPLYSLVAHLTDGIEQPSLLINQPQSAHHHNLRPSERRMLANARIIIRIGPEMESWLNKVITQQQESTQVISVIQAQDLTLLNIRKHHSHDEKPQTENTFNQHHNIDPHIWLSVDNAAAISTYIMQVLIADNPAATKKYRDNLKKLLVKIYETKTLIKLNLQSRDKPFITYHDAFQYFETENNLNYIDTINFSDEAGVSLKHIRYIKTLVKNRNIQCLVYQSPKPAIIDALTEQTAINTVELDLLANHISNTKNAWFELMKQLSLNFNRCLS